MFPTRFLTVILPLLLLSTPLPAQQSRVIPASTANSGGNAASFPPFVVDAGLMQQIIEGSALSVRSSLINSLAYRRDTNGGGVLPGRRIPSLTIRMGTAKRSPATMSSTFADNRSGRLVTLFSGSYNLPTQAAVRGVGPWNIVWKFTNPFVYLNTKGHLLIEIEMPGNARTKFRYTLDGFMAGTTGSTKSFGSKGRFKTADRFNMFSSADGLRPGGEAKMDVVLLKQNYPAFAIYGASNRNFGPIPLPLDLGPLGAPGNLLHVSFDIMFPIPTRRIAATSFSARAVLPLPNLVALEGATLYGQTFFLDIPSNALGLVFSNGTRMTLGKGKAAPFQTVHGLNTNFPHGGFAFFGKTGGPIPRLTGSFN